MASSRGARPLSELLPEPRPERFPHVHADHTLDEALRRIAQNNVRALPVISRTNIREIKGTVSLEDIMAAYRIGKTVE